MEWFYISRLCVATLLGLAIGFERKIRFKEAGVRTHSIVALGACLMMIISLYAFSGEYDSARVAAQIVSGVGFLGAGMIMFKSQGGIHGLTTAAGIWVTAGIGMAIGGGLYLLGCGATVLVVLIQCLLHLPFNFLKTKRYVQLKIVFENNEKNNEIIKQIFDIKSFSTLRAIKEDGKIMFSAVLVTDVIYKDTFINKVMEENDFIKLIERTDKE